MDIHPILISILEQIRFADRYKILCDEYCDFNNRLKNYDHNKIKSFYESKGLEVKASSIDRVFMINETIGDFNIQFNIIPNNGFLQFVLDVVKNNERYNLSWGVWESITRELIGVESGKPMFRNYEELEAILERAFCIYDEFKEKLSSIR